MFLYTLGYCVCIYISIIIQLSVINSWNRFYSDVDDDEYYDTIVGSLYYPLLTT